MWDVLFMHPGGINKSGLQGPYFPIGLIGLADLLRRNGYDALIVNLFLQQIKTGENAETLLDRYKARIYCVDLHWFVHSYEAVELCRLLKMKYPESFVLLGGITASIFDYEIIENFEFIDAVISGDSEIPLLALVESLIKNKSGFENIPNITFRSAHKKIIRSDNQYLISQNELDEFNTMKFNLVEDWEMHYNIVNADYITVKNFKRNPGLEDYLTGDIKKSWILYTGRGCSFRCSFCGGTSRMFGRVFGRKLLLRSPGVIAREIMNFDKLGIDSLYIPHSPFIVDGEFHKRILDCLEHILKKENKNGLDIGFIFEDCPFFYDYGIVSRYLELFNTGNSLIRLYIGSVESGIQKKNNLYPHTQALSSFIEHFHKKINIMVCGLIGLPGQTAESTVNLGNYLNELKNLGCIVAVYNAELHPGSEIFSDPEHFGALLKLKNFTDYYTFLKNKNDKSMIYGYEITGGMKISEQRELINRCIYGR